MRALEDDAQVALVIGHNPGLEDLARGLASLGESRALASLRSKLPTAGLAVIELPVDSAIGGHRDVGLEDGRVGRREEAFGAGNDLGAGPSGQPEGGEEQASAADPPFPATRTRREIMNQEEREPAV